MWHAILASRRLLRCLFLVLDGLDRRPSFCALLCCAVLLLPVGFGLVGHLRMTGAWFDVMELKGTGETWNGKVIG
jgi:hypothetical protein